MPREPAAQAFFTACVWVIEVCTQQTKASLAAIAAAISAGGSCPSRSRGIIVMTIGMAPAENTAFATLSAIAILESSATINTFSPGFTPKHTSATVLAPRAIMISFIAILLLFRSLVHKTGLFTILYIL
jgi:hypothetical protein